MIFGCSAGGLDVGTLILSPLASNLFQRAAMQSPAPGFFEYQDLKIIVLIILMNTLIVVLMLKNFLCSQSAT